MTNASTWFYTQPEPIPYLIAERINNTFWSARIVDVYWQCTRAEAPYQCVGDLHGDAIRMEWEPGEWLLLAGPETEAFHQIMDGISQRVLARPAAVTYRNRQGQQVYEWHAAAGSRRWNELQGDPTVLELKRLSKA
ncbi:MAG: hypothetical protein ACFB51_15555 [Anaerolineae bacterium]